MFSFLKSNSDTDSKLFDNVVDGLKKLYKRKLYPLEEHYLFDKFHSPFLDDPDFDAKPMILLIGQYSTGKNYIYQVFAGVGLSWNSDWTGAHHGPIYCGDEWRPGRHYSWQCTCRGSKKAISTIDKVWKQLFKSISMLSDAE